MSTQAGWYTAPGEPGMLRYWSGDAWTDHRQPAVPVVAVAPVVAAPPVAAVPPVPAAVPVVAAAQAFAGSTSDAAMHPFEQQFAPAAVQQPLQQQPILQHPFQQQPILQQPSWPQPTAQSAAPAAGQPDISVSARPDPYATSTSHPPIAGSGHYPTATTPHSTLGGLVNLGLSVDGIPIGPGSLSQLSEFTEAGSQIASAMQDARARAAVQPRSTALKGAVKGMIAGLVIIVLGVALVLFFSAQSTVGAGEAAIQGTVSSDLGIGSSCRPNVSFTVGSQTYGANQGIGGSCQSDTVGDPVDVIYNVADPSVGARYDFGDPVESFDFLVPVFGVVVFISGLAAFLTRLVRRRSQLAAEPDRP